MRRLLALVSMGLFCGGAMLAGQSLSVPSSQATGFMGTWTFAMTEPPNSEQTVKIWDKNGIVGASLQISKFPPNEATGILKDGDVLILTTTVRENGVPIWAVVALKREGNMMVMSQMIQHSPVVKRGTAVSAVGL
jgi:hypothetical protein